jgi:hypothetical protein
MSENNCDTRTDKERATHEDVANVLEHMSIMVRKGAVKGLKMEWTAGEMSVKMDLRAQTDNIQLCLDFNLNRESRE